MIIHDFKPWFNILLHTQLIVFATLCLEYLGYVTLPWTKRFWALDFLQSYIEVEFFPWALQKIENLLGNDEQSEVLLQIKKSSKNQSFLDSKLFCQ